MHTHAHVRTHTHTHCRLTMNERLPILEPFNLHGGVTQGKQLALKVHRIVLLQRQQILDMCLELGRPLLLLVIQVLWRRCFAFTADVFLHR